jgi:hypothetical protein
MGKITRNKMSENENFTSDKLMITEKCREESRRRWEEKREGKLLLKHFSGKPKTRDLISLVCKKKKEE